MRTVVGRVCDELGIGARHELVQGADRPELRFNTWASPPSEYRSVQPSRIGVDWGHDHQPLGAVEYLERSDGRGLWAVATVDDSVRESVAVRVGEEMRAVPVDLYWSAETSSTMDYRDIELLSLALTPSPAQTSTMPVRFLDGGLEYPDAPKRWGLKATYERDLLFRAAQAASERRRNRGGPLIIHDLDQRPVPTLYTASSTRPVETRSAEVADVSTTGRTVSIVAAPYHLEAPVVVDGRQVMESFSNTAWLDVDKQTNRKRIRVWRDHRPELVCGRVVELDPFAQDGLLATFKVSATPTGDQVLTELRDDLLDASVGFKVLDERWEGRSRRRVTRAWLHHLGVVGDAAYGGTHVVGIRDR